MCEGFAFGLDAVLPCAAGRPGRSGGKTIARDRAPGDRDPLAFHAKPRQGAQTTAAGEHGGTDEEAEWQELQPRVHGSPDTDDGNVRTGQHPGTAPESRSARGLAVSNSATQVGETQRSSRAANARWVVDFGDDPRFEGSYVGETLLAGDRGHDASDCRELYEAGLIRLFGVDPVSGRVHFGDDSSEYAHDGECDDIRFSGNGVAWILVDDERGRDATDCRQLYEAGGIQLFGVHAR